MGVRFPRRLAADDTALNRMARGLSWRAPHPREVLHPEPFALPTPLPPNAGEGEAGWLRWLEHWSAEDVRFEDGVPVSCSLAGRAFLTLGGWLFRHAPIRDVRLVAVAPFVGELAVCPWVAKLYRLDLAGNWIGSEGVKMLVAAAAFAGLAELGVSDNGLTADEVHAVEKLFPGRLLR